MSEPASTGGHRSPTTWRDVPFEQIADLLQPFHPRGRGNVRDRLVRCETPTLTETNAVATVSVECSHTLHGRYRLTLRDAEVRRWGEERRAPTVDDLRSLERHPFTVYDSAGRYYGTIRPRSGKNDDRTPWTWPGVARCAELMSVVERDVAAEPAVEIHTHQSFAERYDTYTWYARRLDVERVDADGATGACAGCGSLQYTLSCRATVPVVASDVDAVSLDPVASDLRSLAEHVTLSKAFTTITCRTCRLEKATNVFGLFEGTIGGAAWGEQSANVRLAALYDHSRKGQHRGGTDIEDRLVAMNALAYERGEHLARAWCVAIAGIEAVDPVVDQERHAWSAMCGEHVPETLADALIDEVAQLRRENAELRTRLNTPTNIDAGDDDALTAEASARRHDQLVELGDTLAAAVGLLGDYTVMYCGDEIAEALAAWNEARHGRT